jgi:hypothetical protein
MNNKLTPSMALNAAKVKAAQNPAKPGAEKPDLGAPGKKVEKKASKTPPQFLPKAKKKDKDCEKKAGIDDAFGRDLRQIVGIESEAESDWQRPDVSVQGQATDRIDDHFLGWMGDKADEDVVKEATLGGQIGQAAKKAGGKVEVALRKAKKVVKKNPGVVAGAGAAGLTAGSILGRMSKKTPAPAPVTPPDTGVKVPDGQVKQAGVVENQENLDLMTKLRKAAGEKFTTGTNDI